jgi:formate hydrogenlyase subunit 3/multisubunit Na+/H+ antiporter MnhD subunit
MDEPPGGPFFIAAIAIICPVTGTLELQQILASANTGAEMFLPALALLCVAAFVKSAQFPFQSWLLDAMVARRRYQRFPIPAQRYLFDDSRHVLLSGH